MNIPIQIDQISIARAKNAAHYEYLTTVLQRVEQAELQNGLWRQAVDEFIIAYKAEDKAFKQYRASERTQSIAEADAERDQMYASLRDAIKAFAKFPLPATAEQAAPLMRVIRNYGITTREDYMRESGLIDNMLQDLLQFRPQLAALGLWDLANNLKQKNAELRELIASRNEERMEQVLGELKAARQASDAAYAVLVFYTNAFFAMNPTVREAERLVMQMQEDLEYFSQHSMPDPHRTRDAAPDDGGEPQPEDDTQDHA